MPDTCTLDTTLLHTVSSSHGKRVRKRGLTPDIIQPHVWRILDGAPLDAAPPGTAPLGTVPLVRITSRVYALDLFHTWAQLASYVPFESLIVLGDSTIRAVASQPTSARGRSPVEVRRDLLASIAAMPKFNGKTACLRAGTLIAANVDSPKESECRLLLRRHGLPKVETGYTVPEARFRSGAAMTLDLAWPQWRVAVEYDGDHHRTDRKQWRRDQEKREYLRSRG
ncbi:hypothetical protein [Bifidobacterium aerophilum]|uniref:hypothetical protein n=1 Tax=Bifidobacterium aerophilum TaxID=1798155 RepID=UPI001EF8CD15|nr:hypothetical protein [Bifidobacterium aerophilum]